MCAGVLWLFASCAVSLQTKAPLISAREMQGDMYVRVCTDSRVSMEPKMHMCRFAAVGD